MNARELIDILKDYPPDHEIELAIVCPIVGDEPVAVDRFEIAGVLPWDEEDEETGDEVVTLWLIGGEDDDVDAFMDAVDAADEGDEVE